jgi:hypothetical protein
VTDIFADHNVSRRITDRLRVSGHVVTLAGDERLARAHDEALFLLAARRQLVVLTHDREDFLLLHRAWQLWSADWGIARDHSGILAMEQGPPDRLVAEIESFLQTSLALTNRLYAWRSATGWVDRS